jgi:hypothetical protein
MGEVHLKPSIHRSLPGRHIRTRGCPSGKIRIAFYPAQWKRSGTEEFKMRTITLLLIALVMAGLVISPVWRLPPA